MFSSAFFQDLAILAVPFLLGITCHELAHGLVSHALGDPTPRRAGRLTLNPVRHLDPLGTLALVLTQTIGWAKPVPVDPSYYRHPRRDMVLVAAAGPAANMLVGLGFAALLWTLTRAPLNWDNPHVAFWAVPLVRITAAGVTINAALALFNLIPIPPLDGSKILAALLPPSLAGRYLRMERYGFLAILLLAVTGGLSLIIRPALHWVHEILLG